MVRRPVFRPEGRTSSAPTDGGYAGKHCGLKGRAYATLNRVARPFRPHLCIVTLPSPMGWAEEAQPFRPKTKQRHYFFGVTFSTNESLWPPLVGWYISSPRAGGSVNSPANSASTTNSAAARSPCS